MKEPHSLISVTGIRPPTRLIGTQILLNELKSFKILYTWASHHMTTELFFRSSTICTQRKIHLLSVYMDVSEALSIYLVFFLSTKEKIFMMTILCKVWKGSLGQLSLKLFDFFHHLAFVWFKSWIEDSYPILSVIGRIMASRVVVP